MANSSSVADYKKKLDAFISTADQQLLSTQPGSKCSSGDQISKLPDDVLLAILSFLTLKEAVGTCILSSRWVDMWKFVAWLNFEDIGASIKIRQIPILLKVERNKYVSWVDQVLRAHKGQMLKELRICFNLDNSHKLHIDKWLKFAFGRSVQSLELDLLGWGKPPRCSASTYSLPDELFAQSSNTSSGFHQLNCSGLLLPTLPDFTPLKALCLKCVNVTGKNFEFFLSHCPMLEHLTVHGSGELVNLDISGSSLLLRSLEICYCHNLKTVKIYNTNLTSFKFVGDTRCLVLNNLPFLVEASIGKFGLLKDVFALLSSCLCNLERLTLHAALEWEAIDSDTFPELPKLKHLTVNVEVMGTQSVVEFASLVNMSPFLHKFTLQLDWWCALRIDDDEVREVVRCPHPYLRVVEIGGYYARTHDLEVVIYFLKNAFALEELIIDPRNPFHTYSRLPKLDLDISIEEINRALTKEQLQGNVPSHVKLTIL